MCIAIACPPNIRPTKKTLRQCFDNNPDGAGFAFPGKNKVKIRKGFFTWRSFWIAYRNAPIDCSMLIHFRIATSGKIDGENCHPFRINDRHALIHNGNLSGKLGLDCENLSDTALFVSNILRPTIALSASIIKTAAFKYLMEESIGYSNKCVIINGDGEFYIFGEKNGVWSDGVWYSNKSFTAEKVHRPSASSGTFKFNNGTAISAETYSLKRDVVNSAPPNIFWKKKTEAGNTGISLKRAEFYAKRQQEQMKSVTATTSTNDLTKVEKTTIFPKDSGDSSAFSSLARTSGRNWTQII